MGYGFGPNGFGSAANSNAWYDELISQLTTNNTTGIRSYFIRFFFGGHVLNSGAYLFFKDNGFGSGIPVFKATSSTVMSFNVSKNSVEGQWTIPAPSLLAWHDALIVHDYSATNPPVIYIDGVLQTVTTVATPAGLYNTSTAGHKIGNSSTNDSGTTHVWDGILTDFAVWDAQLGQQEAYQLMATSPINIMPEALVEYLPEWENYKSLRQANPTSWKTGRWAYPSPIGYDTPIILKPPVGSAYNAALALGLTMAVNDNAQLNVAAGLSLGMAMGVSESGNNAAVAALTLGLTAGFSPNAFNGLAGAVSLASTLGLGTADALGMSAASALGLTLGLAPSDTVAMGAALALAATLGFVPSQGSTSNYNAALALGLTLTTGGNSTSQMASSLALGLGLQITSFSINQLGTGLTLGVMVGAGANVGVDFNVNIPLALLTGLQSAGGQSYGASLALGLILGEAIAAATGLQVVPTERILAVQAENRTLNIQVENRTLLIAIENRTINVKLE